MIADMVTILENDSGVGGVVGDRIYPGVTPQEDFGQDRVAYELVYSTPSLDTNGNVGINQSTWAFYCYSETSSVQAALIAEKIRLALEGTTEDTSPFHAIDVERETDNHIPSKDGTGLTTYCRIIDFTIWHTVTTA